MAYIITCVTLKEGVIDNVSYRVNSDTIKYTITKREFVSMIDSTAKIFTESGTEVYVVGSGNNKYLSSDKNITTKDNLAVTICK